MEKVKEITDVTEKEEAFKSYKEHLENLSKDDLISIITGDENRPPLLTKDEPTFSRPQLIWAMRKYNKDYIENKDTYDEIIDDSVEVAESQVETLIQFIHGKYWTFFYNYDWIRFDIRKPGYRWFLLGFGCTIFTIIKLIGFIISLF